MRSLTAAMRPAISIMAGDPLDRSVYPSRRSRPSKRSTLRSRSRHRSDSPRLGASSLARRSRPPVDRDVHEPVRFAVLLAGDVPDAEAPDPRRQLLRLAVERLEPRVLHAVLAVHLPNHQLGVG